MGKKKQKETEPKSQNGDVSTQSGIFSSLFGAGVSEGERTGGSTLFSDDNPFRRKPAYLKPSGDEDKSDFASSDEKKIKEKKRNISTDSPAKNDDEEIAATSSVKGKRRKKEIENGGSNDEKDSNLGIAQEGKSVSGTESKRKKRKRDEVEKEYEEKKYGKASEEGEEKKEKKVGEKRKKSEEVADTTMVSKEGFDDESKLLRTIFVGNLPLEIKKKAILKEFSKFGEVDSVRIRSVPIADTKKTRKGAIMQKQIHKNASSVHAYVVFTTEQSAEASLAHNMSLIAGNHIRVDRACPPRKKLKGQDALLYDSKRTVFVGNLPFDAKDEELYQLFSGMSNLENGIEAIRVIRDSHLNIGKGIAYVLFKSQEAANLVLKKGNLKLRGRELRLSRTKSDSTPSKRKNHASDAYSPAKKLPRDKVIFSGGRETDKSNRKAILSYQGLRASKSSTNKKNPRSAKTKPKDAGDQAGNPKERKLKRPAVAARKARANGSQESGVKRAGTKRKQDSRTPESFSRKKKAKRF